MKVYGSYHTKVVISHKAAVGLYTIVVWNIVASAEPISNKYGEHIIYFFCKTEDSNGKSFVKEIYYIYIQCTMNFLLLSYMWKIAEHIIVMQTRYSKYVHVPLTSAKYCVWNVQTNLQYIEVYIIQKKTTLCCTALNHCY